MTYNILLSMYFKALLEGSLVKAQVYTLSDDSLQRERP